jgi:hypothetical protein
MPLAREAQREHRDALILGDLLCKSIELAHVVATRDGDRNHLLARSAHHAGRRRLVGQTVPWFVRRNDCDH